MSYKIEKPYTKKEKIDFIIEYNHKQGLRIEELKTTMYALEANEIIVNGEPQLDPEYEKRMEQKEQERVKSLKMTKRVFALGLQQLGISYKQLRELISTKEQAQLEWDLCVELERSNPLLDEMALQLGITSEQLDNMFIIANANSDMNLLENINSQTKPKLLEEEGKDA